MGMCKTCTKVKGVMRCPTSEPPNMVTNTRAVSSQEILMKEKAQNNKGDLPSFGFKTIISYLL